LGAPGKFVELLLLLLLLCTNIIKVLCRQLSVTVHGLLVTEFTITRRCIARLCSNLPDWCITGIAMWRLKPSMSGGTINLKWQCSSHYHSF